MGATLQGSIEMNGAGAVDLVVRFFTPDTDTEIFKTWVRTEADGNFTVEDCPEGTYDVGIKASHSLSLLAEDKVFVAGETTEVDFGTMLRGDLDNDDACDYIDLAIFGDAYRKIGDCVGYGGNWNIPAIIKPRDIIFINGKPCLNLSEDDSENELYLEL